MAAAVAVERAPALGVKSEREEDLGLGRRGDHLVLVRAGDGELADAGRRGTPGAASTS